MQPAQETMLKILKTFPPEDFSRRRYGRYRIIVDIMVCLEIDKQEFTSDDLTFEVSRKEREKKSELTECVLPVLSKLCSSGLLNKNTKGFYRFSIDATSTLKEFFGLTVQSRKVRSGFARYLSKSTKRIILWYCLCHERSIDPDEVSKMLSEGFLERPSKELVSTCNKHLYRFEKRKWLTRNGLRYKLANETEIFKELLVGYESFTAPRLTLKDQIRNVIDQHEFASSKMVCNDLRELEIPFDESSVYKQMKELEKEKALTKTDSTRRGKNGHGSEKLYAVEFGDPLKHNKMTAKKIKERLAKSAFILSDKFYEEAEKQKPNALEVFLVEMRWGFLLRNEDQTASVRLWLSFIKELQRNSFQGYPKPMFSSTISEDQCVAELEKFSRKYRISPLAVAMLHLSSGSVQ